MAEIYTSHIQPGCTLTCVAVGERGGRCIDMVEHFYSEAFIPSYYGRVKSEIWVVLINPYCKWSVAWLEIQSSCSLLLDLGKPCSCRQVQAKNVDLGAQHGLWLSSQDRLFGFSGEHCMRKLGVPLSPHLLVWQRLSILLLCVRLMRWGPWGLSPARMAVSLWLLASDLRQFGIIDRGEAGN